MDFRQDAASRRRLEDAAPRPALYARAAASWERSPGTRRSTRSRRGSRRAAAGKIGAIAGDLCAVEDMFAAEDCSMNARLAATSIAARSGRSSIRRTAARSYLFNSTIAGVDQADAVLIIGSNPRMRGRRCSMRASARRWLHGHFHGRLDRRDGRSRPIPINISAPARTRCAEVAAGRRLRRNSRQGRARR